MVLKFHTSFEFATFSSDTCISAKATECLKRPGIASLAHCTECDCILVNYLFTTQSVAINVTFQWAREFNYIFLRMYFYGYVYGLCFCQSYEVLCDFSTSVCIRESERVPKHCHLVDGWSYWSLAVTADKRERSGAWHDTEQDREDDTVCVSLYMSLSFQKECFPFCG